MKLFDGHCDTAYELWTRGEGLERNSFHPRGRVLGRSAC